jgi:hypothetical protein
MLLLLRNMHTLHEH